MNKINEMGIEFNDELLLRRALCHSSYANQKGTEESNEKLEFLGDAVLQLIITEHLYKTLPGKEEGELTKIRAMIVCEPSLFEIAEKWELGRYIMLSKGEELTGGRKRASLLADAVEALIAAVYLDKGLLNTSEFVLKTFSEIIEKAVKDELITDFKTRLQELLQENGDIAINYEIEKFEGPPHRRKFFSKVSIEEITMGRGEGMSKKEAEQAAAKDALSKLALRGE